VKLRQDWRRLDGVGMLGVLWRAIGVKSDTLEPDKLKAVSRVFCSIVCIPAGACLRFARNLTEGSVGDGTPYISGPIGLVTLGFDASRRFRKQLPLKKLKIRCLMLATTV